MENIVLKPVDVICRSHVVGIFAIDLSIDGVENHQKADQLRFVLNRHRQTVDVELGVFKIVHVRIHLDALRRQKRKMRRDLDRLFKAFIDLDVVLRCAFRFGFFTAVTVRRFDRRHETVTIAVAISIFIAFHFFSPRIFSGSKVLKL